MNPNKTAALNNLSPPSVLAPHTSVDSFSPFYPQTWKNCPISTLKRRDDQDEVRVAQVTELKQCLFKNFVSGPHLLKHKDYYREAECYQNTHERKCYNEILCCSVMNMCLKYSEDTP